MKILFTSVGRRVELMQAFKNAACELGVDLKIIGVDITESAPALCFCDGKHIVCQISDENYISSLLKICADEKVDCLIPTIDTDLLVLSEHKARFEEIGTKVLVAAPEKVRICRDKNYTADYFISLGLKSPKPVDSVEAYTCGYPAFIKPKDGSSSIDAYKVTRYEDLVVYADKIGDYIIQPFISGREFTVDIFCDYEGSPVLITPRERLAVRSGEVLKTRICQDDVMIEEMKTLVADFKPSGQITVQLIRDENTEENYYIEINPRFGGGAPLSIKAGADSAKAVIRMLMGEKLEYMPYAARNGAIFSRFDQSVCVDMGDSTHAVHGVIFDLDDTLYNEKDYVRSGYRAVARYLGIPDAESKLWEYFENNLPAIDTYLAQIGRTEQKEECLRIYREHVPDIKLQDGAKQLIAQLKKKGIKVGIITDGRPVGQRNKLKALGLDALVDDIIVTDELGGEQFRKPCDIAFRIMQQKWRIPFGEMMYVGDNLTKDFQAPKQLGMLSLHLKNEQGLYMGHSSAVLSVDCFADAAEFILSRVDTKS